MTADIKINALRSDHRPGLFSGRAQSAIGPSHDAQHWPLGIAVLMRNLRDRGLINRF